MRINFLLNQVFDGWDPTDTRLGGTEQSVVEWTEELTKRGHQCHVYRNGRQNLDSHNGVVYWPRYEYGANGGVTINIKSPDVKPIGPTLFYTNDVDADKQDLSAFDAVVHISRWAKDNIPVNNPSVFVVPHGYDETRIYPDKKIRKQCIYASSPDRGLDILLRVWPKVIREHPDATLFVTYGADGPTYKGIYYLGDISEEQIDELYRTSEYWLYPCVGNELFCITGIKAQAAGCYPVYFPHMALSETVKYGTRSNRDRLAYDIIESLYEYEVPKPLPPQPTIKQSTDKLMKVVEYVLGKKNANNQ